MQPARKPQSRIPTPKSPLPLLLLALLAATTAQATLTVSNVSAVQQPGTKRVQIVYDVAADTPTVSLEVRDGATVLPATSLTGDIGPGVTPGTGRSIVWDMGADWNGNVAAGVTFTVTADAHAAEPGVTDNMVLIPGGTNSGTNPQAGGELHDNWYPATYDITVSSFSMDRYLVTKGLWDQVRNDPATVARLYTDLPVGGGQGVNHPVHTVSWFDALKWLNARSELAGREPVYYLDAGYTQIYRSGSGGVNPGPYLELFVKASANGYRMATMDEWEYAARGGLVGRRYPWGDAINQSQANYLAGSFHPEGLKTGSKPYTTPVDFFAPNGYGIYDVAGNLFEWNYDWHLSRVGIGREIRGGCWNNGAAYSRVGYRSYGWPGSAYNNTGFRAVLTATGGSATTTADLDSRDYTLTVASDHGNPTPGVGTHTYAWQTKVNASVEAVSGAFVCTGWTGTGAVPESGVTHKTGKIVLDEVESTLVWTWEEIPAPPEPGDNLLVNPGFETGDFTGWQPAAGTIVSADHVRSGAYGAGVSQGPGAAWQDVDVAAFADCIDVGNAAIEAGGYVGGFADVFVTRAYLDATGQVLATDERSGGDSGDWVHVGFKDTPPVGTRAVRLQFEVRSDSEVADAGWDDAHVVVWCANPDEFDYTIANGEVTLIGYFGPGGDVVIPAVIEALPVTTIGARAFLDGAGLTRVTIPDSINAFGDGAFRNCTALATVTIGHSVTAIGNGAFAGCSSLPSFTVDPANPSFTSFDGVLFNKERTALVQYPIGRSDSQYTIPESVTTIGEDAFSGGTSLTRVTIPAGVTAIGHRAFAHCTGIVDVLFHGNAPTSVGDGIYLGSTPTSYRLPGAAGWGHTFAGRPVEIWGLEGMWPTGGVVLDDRQPEFFWSAVAGANWYEVYVTGNGQVVGRSWVEGAVSWTPTDELRGGNYRWRVRSWGPEIGMQAWSGIAEFGIQVAPPVAPVPVSVGDPPLHQRRPLLRWDAPGPEAAWFQVHLNRDGRTHLSQWVERATQWTPSADLPAGRYDWWVRGWNVDGFSPWSGPVSAFNIAAMRPEAIEQLGPAGPQPGNDVTFQWLSDERATWYRVWVRRPGGGIWHDQWVASPTTAVVVSGHPGGESDWWLLGWGPDGLGPWSGPMFFETPDPSPAVPTLVAPLGVTTSPVTLEYASERGEWFRVYVQRGSTRVFDDWSQATTLDLDLGPQPAGRYAWWVGAWNQVSGRTVWSERGEFTVE